MEISIAITVVGLAVLFFIIKKGNTGFTEAALAKAQAELAKLKADNATLTEENKDIRKNAVAAVEEREAQVVSLRKRIDSMATLANMPFNQFCVTKDKIGPYKWSSENKHGIRTYAAYKYIAEPKFRYGPRAQHWEKIAEEYDLMKLVQAVNALRLQAYIEQETGYKMSVRWDSTNGFCLQFTNDVAGGEIYYNPEKHDEQMNAIKEHISKLGEA